mmetsp:Transcript_141568/g.368988  ORF Transcript_141568/g.368988 Transcript_141568/m.368988 type:complete len:360 (+) Transcript_141568:50-1129(+)
MSLGAMPRLRRQSRATRIISALFAGVALWNAFRVLVERGFVVASDGVVARRHRCISRQAGDNGDTGMGGDEATIVDESTDLPQRLRIEDLQPGQALNGLVSSVAPFGAFVDVGADREGLVHISQITDGYVDDIRKFVDPGQIVKVRVLEVGADGKLALTMVKEEVEIDWSVFEKMSTDEWMDAMVEGYSDFGAFVFVTPPGGGTSAKGMIHISQIREGFIEHPSDELEVGQAVRVRVDSVDAARGRLRVSMREARPSHAGPSRPAFQDVSAFSAVKQEEWLVGTVHHTMHFGIFVDLPNPDGKGTAQGLVHVTEIKDGFVEDPALEVAVGQEVRVRVVNVDTNLGRLVLSMRELSMLDA